MSAVLPVMRARSCNRCASEFLQPVSGRALYCDSCWKKNRSDKAMRQRRNRIGQPIPECIHGTTTGYSNYSCRCVRCCAASRAYRNEWRKRPEVADRIRKRARELAKRPEEVLRKKAYQYGLDVDLLSSYLDDRVCFACGTEDVRLAVDHDHGCCSSSRKVCGQCVRGLLCDPCNKALGLVGDDVERLRNLIAYLERWEQRARQ